MKYIKKSYGWMNYIIALMVVTACGLIHRPSPAWAEEVVTQGVSQETVQALNKKIDLLIDTLSTSGQVHFSDALKEEFTKLNQKISPNPQQARLENPQQARLENPQQARLENPQQARLENPQQARLENPQQARLENPQQARLENPQQARLENPQQALIAANPSWINKWIKH